MPPRRSLLRSFSRLAVIGLFSQASCFYFSTINERPRPRIQEKTSGPYTMASELVFSATGSRDDQGLDRLTAEWKALTCNVDGLECVENVTVVLADTSRDFVVSPRGKGTLRVELTLRDRHGATEKVFQVFPVINEVPRIEVQVSDDFPDPGDLGGFVLGLPLQLAAKVTDLDGDEVTLSWDYEAPSGAGSDPDAVIFEPVDGKPTLHELIGDVAGVWEVTVTGDDGDGGIVTATKQIVFAPDGPPCLGAISPATKNGDVVLISGAAKTFSVLTALDALDPWPEVRSALPQFGKTTFHWSVATPSSGGAYVPLANLDVPELVLQPSDHTLGDRLSVRVELEDRLARTVDCPVGEPTCSDAANACSQRMTWEVEIR